MLLSVDPTETLLQRIREEETLAREADERHDMSALEGHDQVIAALMDRALRVSRMTLAGTAAMLEAAEAMVVESGVCADEADLADAAELAAVAGRFRAGEVRETDRAFLAYLASDPVGGLGEHHAGAVRLIRAAARSALRPSFGEALAA